MFAVPCQQAGRIPLIHLTDLYDPPQDPDDHIDLATIVALPEFDLQGVVLDVTDRFLVPAPIGYDIARAPGLESVARLGRIVGRTIPVAVGPRHPLRNPNDTAADRPPSEQVGIAFLLELLERSPQPVMISVVGSARALAAAYNRNPQLVRAKTRAVLLNAGSTAGVKREWNVGLDVHAYVALWRSNLPLRWYPCATDRGAFDPAHVHGTFWRATHARLFAGLSEPMREWFREAMLATPRLAGGADGGARAGEVTWEQELAQERNLWATISLTMAAGRVLARTHDGWRFVTASEVIGQETWPVRLDSIRAEVDPAGVVTWHTVPRADTTTMLFARQPGGGYGVAMAEALNALLCSIGRPTEGERATQVSGTPKS
ncbi:hypothetical protein [Opitutus terrae]|nr:hypothetical protein [Opitutus terrae]